MRINFFLIALLVASMAHAQSRTEFKDVSKGKQMDLLQEGNTLRLPQENSIQAPVQTSRNFTTLLFGGVQPSSLSASSNGHTMNYNFDHYLPLATFQFNHFIWQSFGKWGWSGSIGYSYSQYQDTATTALHLVPINLSAVYRMDLKDTQKIIPYLMAGPSLWTYFQRGPDAYNTSQSTVLGAGTAGVAFNLNRFHLLNSENGDTELTLQYQRAIGPSGGAMDFNGNTIQIGGSISL